MGGNQTQIPVIQSPDQNITLLQQNTNKVFRNINNQVVDLQSAVDQLTIIGEIKIADLTEDQFNAVAGPSWLLCDGQSCVGTAFAQLTGNLVVPTLTVGGFNTFIKVE